VLGLFEHGHVAGDCRARVDEVGGIERRAARLALVAIGVLVAAMRAGARDVAVGKKLVGMLIVILLARLLDKFALVVELLEKLACRGSCILEVVRE
jgi:hypothetical protein